MLIAAELASADNVVCTWNRFARWPGVKWDVMDSQRMKARIGTVVPELAEDLAVRGGSPPARQTCRTPSSTRKGRPKGNDQQRCAPSHIALDDSARFDPNALPARRILRHRYHSRSLQGLGRPKALLPMLRLPKYLLMLPSKSWKWSLPRRRVWLEQSSLAMVPLLGLLLLKYRIRRHTLPREKRGPSVCQGTVASHRPNAGSLT